MSSIKEKFTTAIAKLKWRTLYRTMHKLESQYDMAFIPAFWHMRILGEIVDPVGGSIDKLVDQLMHATFDVIYEKNYELSVLAYNNLDDDERFNLIRNITLGLHNKIAKTPEMQNALRDVKLHQPKNPKKFARKRKYMAGRYNFGTMEISYSMRGLNRPIGAVISTVIHEYIHVLQSTYNSALPRQMLKLSRHRPLARLMVPYKKRLLEIEAHRANKIVTNDFDSEFQYYLDKKRRDFYN